MKLDIALAGSRIAMRGRIDDVAHLAALVDRVPPGEVAIDTDGVTFINSVGMREWLRFVRALAKRGPVVLERVALVLITQLNLVGDHSARIASFYAPYVCPACGGEHAQLIDVAEHAQALRRLEAPPLPCPECGAAMELGDFSERYLSIFRG